MTAIETLKQWFSNLKKPTQEQFWAWLDSFWHKSEKIPMASVEGLDKLVEGTASAEQLSNHLNDTQAHKVLFDKKVDKVEGKELSSNDFTNDYKQKLDTLQPTDTSELLPKGGYDGTGKELKDAIDSLQTKMGQVEMTLSVDDTAFDTLQEIITQVKSNKNLKQLLTAKVNKEDGKGLSSNDFTNELKSKLEGLSPLIGFHFSGNLIKGNKKFLNITPAGLTSLTDFKIESPFKTGKYLLIYNGRKIEEGFFIKLLTQDNQVIELYDKVKFLHTDVETKTQHYLLDTANIGIDVNISSIQTLRVPAGEEDTNDPFNLQLRRIFMYPEWETDRSRYNTYASEVYLNETQPIIELGRCNIVFPRGENPTTIYIPYLETATFSIMKVGYGNDNSKISFKTLEEISEDGIPLQIMGDTEITGKTGSRAEGVCAGKIIYITVHNRE